MKKFLQGFGRFASNPQQSFKIRKAFHDVIVTSVALEVGPADMQGSMINITPFLDIKQIKKSQREPQLGDVGDVFDETSVEIPHNDNPIAYGFPCFRIIDVGGVDKIRIFNSKFVPGDRLLIEQKLHVIGFANGEAEIVEYHPISAGEVAAKEFPLMFLPGKPQNVKIDAIGGPAQHYSVDYMVESNFVKWNGLAWESEIQDGHTLRVSYLTIVY